MSVCLKTILIKGVDLILISPFIDLPLRIHSILLSLSFFFGKIGTTTPVWLTSWGSCDYPNG
jgi:hypothetical protein